MSSDSESLWSVGPSVIDLVIVLGLGVWTVLSAPEIGYSFSRPALGFVAILFAPGYALVAALFPRNGIAVSAFDRLGVEKARKYGRVGGLERLVLAVGVSVCLVPLLEIGLYVIPLEVGATDRLGIVGTTTVLLTIVAAVRRFRVPAWERFGVRGPAFILGSKDGVRGFQRDALLSGLLVIGLVIAVSGIGIAALRTTPGEQFTEFYITTESPDTGERVAGGYPDEIPSGETETVSVGVANNEHRQVEYTVVILLQSINEDGTVQEVQRLDRFSLALADGETVHRSHTIEPELSGEDLTVTYLLYVGSGPEREVPRAENAYRSLHFRVDVPETGAA